MLNFSHVVKEMLVNCSVYIKSNNHNNKTLVLFVCFLFILATRYSFKLSHQYLLNYTER